MPFSFSPWLFAWLAVILSLPVAGVAQTAPESLDLNAYNAIREEGLQHSHVMILPVA